MARLTVEATNINMQFRNSRNAAQVAGARLYFRQTAPFVFTKSDPTRCASG